MKKLYHGGKILTMEDRMPAEAVLTDGAKIIGVGKKEELLRMAPDAEPVDLDGKTMLPGFIDAHSHFTQVAMGFLQVSLEGAGSVEEIRSRIREFIQREKIRPGSWVQARDYDHNLLPDGKNLIRVEIESLAPEHALVIQHKSGHSGLMNRTALMRAGITADTKSPEGGYIGKDAKGLTGYLEENAYFAAAKKAPMPGPEELLHAYEMAQEQYASFGITTIQEGMLVDEMLPLYQLLLNARILKLDLAVYPDKETLAAAEQQIGMYETGYHRHVRIGGIKIFLDGSPQGRTAWMTEPYQGEKDYRGYGTMTDEDVLAALKEAGKRKVQIIAHCNGDAAAEQFLDCLEKAEQEYTVLKTLRPVVIHGQFMRPDQMPKAKDLGAVVSFFTAHTWYWGDVHVQNFGLERASRISAAASALACGMPFTFHQDAPVIRPDMLETIWCAVNRRTKNGIVLGADQRIPVWEALKAVTINAAYQYFEEDQKGSITPGKRADFVILSENPLEVPKDRIRKIRVLETIKEGESIFRREY